MRYYIIAGFCILAIFGILALSCEKPVQQVKAPSDIGVIWNYSNASIPITLDLYYTNPNKNYNPLPKSIPPRYLQEPCNSWNTLPDTPDKKQYLIQRRSSYGLNPCSGCHCNNIYADYYTWWVVNLHDLYGDVGQIYYCVNSASQIVYVRDWWANPDTTTIRWRP